MRQGLTGRVLTSWLDMRGSFTWLMAQRPSEVTLLVFLLIAGLFLLLLVLAQTALAPGARPPTADEIGALLVSGIVALGLVLPLALYLVALAGHLLARGFGGTGTGHASRAAMAWSALVSAPVLLLASVAGLMLAPHLPAPAVNVIRSLGLPAFAFAFANCFAEAHGFARPWAVLAVIVAVLFGGLTLLRLAVAG